MREQPEFVLTPEQKKIVAEKVRSLEEFAKHIDFSNLPKRENHPEVSRPVNESKHK